MMKELERYQKDFYKRYSCGCNLITKFIVKIKIIKYLNIYISIMQYQKMQKYGSFTSLNLSSAWIRT
jgi:hypothetical protein